MVGFERPPKRNLWHDEECRAASAAKNDAYKCTLQPAAARAIVEDYRQNRREERHLIKRKKRKQERRERGEIQMYLKRLIEGFKPGASFCRDERANLVADAQRVLRLASLFYVIARLWRH